MEEEGGLRVEWVGRVRVEKERKGGRSELAASWTWMWMENRYRPLTPP